VEAVSSPAFIYRVQERHYYPELLVAEPGWRYLMSRKYGINYFFESVLHAKPRNQRWSWGAIDHRANRVFLRLWEDQLRGDAPGKAVIFWKNKRQTHGYREREAHVQAIKNGAQGFGVICRARDLHDKPREIADYEKDAVVQLTALTDDDRAIYAQTKWISLEELKLFSSQIKNKSGSRTAARS